MFGLDKKEKRIFLAHLNKIVEEAIEHGGDGGGAYYSNAESLIDAMTYFLRWCGAEREVGIMTEDDEEIRFYLKRDIVQK